MDSEKIQISIDKNFFERLIYWLIIIVLAILLIVAWVKDDCEAADTTTDNEQVDTAAGTDEPADTTPPPTAEPIETASCVDGEKNQDETGVDCGGSCTKCATGQACKADADCISAICANSTCMTERPVTLSGKLEFDVKSVTTSKAANGAAKATVVSYSIKNGLSEDFEGFIAKVYIKNTAGTRCYNQQTAGTCDDSYAEFMIDGLKSGKTYTETHTIAKDEYTTKVGSFIIDDAGDNPSQFTVAVYLYDQNGDEINGKSIIDSYQVK